MHDPVKKMTLTLVNMMILIIMVANIGNIVNFLTEGISSILGSPVDQLAAEDASQADVKEETPAKADDSEKTVASQEDTSESFDPTGLLIGLGSVVGVGVVGFGAATAVSYRKESNRAKKEKEAKRKKAADAFTFKINATRERQNELNKLYGDYLMDPREILKNPALSDVSVKTTSEFVEAHALLPSEDFYDLISSQDDLSKAEKLVSAAWQAWRSALNHSRKCGLTYMSLEESKKVRRAQSLLELALDDAASDAERQSAYEQVRKLMEGVLILPQEAIKVIEAKALPAITALKETSSKQTISN